jgi:hypothetical protein
MNDDALIFRRSKDTSLFFVCDPFEKVPAIIFGVNPPSPSASIRFDHDDFSSLKNLNLIISLMSSEHAIVTSCPISPLDKLTSSRGSIFLLASVVVAAHCSSPHLITI